VGAEVARRMFEEFVEKVGRCWFGGGWGGGVVEGERGVTEGGELGGGWGLRTVSCVPGCRRITDGIPDAPPTSTATTAAQE